MADTAERELGAQATRCEVVQRLQAVLGPDVRLSTDASDLARHETDYSGLRNEQPPIAVVYPRTTQQVSEILRLCNTEHLPVTPQGGLTGIAGGATPAGGSVVLSLERMAEIEEVDRDAYAMVVQAGVPLQRVQAEADMHGLYFPLDLGARGSCLIGGNIATNAGGNRVLRFGMARDLVLGLAGC